MDERPSLRAAPDAKPNAPLVYDDTDNKQIRSLKQQTEQSYLKDKWRPNRDDFQQESNDVSVKSSQTDTQSKMGQPVPSKPSQTDTSFLYDEYMRSRGEKKNQDSPSQTAMKPEPNAMGHIRYPTHYSPDRQDVPRSDQVSNASNTASRRQSDHAMPTTPIMPSAIAMSRMESCECRQPVLMPCPSKSLPQLWHCNESNAFQSTCSKQSTQPSHDASVWYSLESENSNATCPASSKPSAPKFFPCDTKSRQMTEECICRDHFKSAQSSGYAPLDLDTDSNMRSAQSKSTKCSCKSSHLKSTPSSRSLPCGQPSRNAPVTVVYCPLRNYVNGPTTHDIEKGQVSPDTTNWQSARSNVSNPCDSQRSLHTCVCSQTNPTVWNSAKSDRTCPSNQSNNDISEASTLELTGLRSARTAPTPWQSVKSNKSMASEAGNPNDPSNLRFLGMESDDTNTVDRDTAAATAWNSLRSNRSSLNDPSGQVIKLNPSDPGFLSIESNREEDTAWNSTAASNYSCGCQTSNQIPMHTFREQTCPRSQRSNAYTIVTSEKQLEDSLVKTSQYTCGKSERPCTCGSSNLCPGSKSSNTDQTTSRSRSVMAKVTCLCSSEQRANLGDTNREGDGGPPFARVEESNLYGDISAADPNLVPAAGYDEQNYTACYDPAQGSPTKVVFKADTFRDCRSSSATSLLYNTGSDSARDQTNQDSKSSTRVYCYDGKSELRISPSGSMKSAISCSCDKENTTEYKSARSDQGPPSQDATMKSVITCLCGKDNLNDYKSAQSGQTTCSCGKDYKSARSNQSPCSCKTSKYDFSMEELSQTPETVGVVMSCHTPTVCVDKDTFDKLSKGQSPNSARDRLLNMVNMVTSDRDPPMDRGELAQQIIRELTMMLRQDEEDSKQPKLSYEDCLEAVQRGERPAKKSGEKSQSEISRLQCLDRMEQYLQTCFPAKKTVEVKEIGGFEVDPDFDPFRKTPAVCEPEPEVRDIVVFRSCYTDVEARFLTPGPPSAAELAASLKGDASGKIPSGDEAPGSSLGVGSEPQASPPQSEGPDAVSSGSGEPKQSRQPSVGPDALSRTSGEAKASPQLSVAPDGVSSVNEGAKASDGASRVSGEPQASAQLSVGADGTSLPVGGAEGSTGNGSEPKSPSMPNEGVEGSTPKTGTSSGRPCGNEDCPESGLQRQLCEVDANDPLCPLTDRERLLCEYLLRRMCEMCEEDQEDEHYGDSEGGPSAPSQPCLCCHCRALVCDNQCKTVAKVLDAASYDPVAEMKFFIDSVVFDLQAMEHVMKKNLLTPSTAKPSPYMGNAPGESFPVTITDVSSLGCRALYVRWELQDCSGVGGYEIYVDGHLTNRFFSHRHEAGVVSNVDVTKRHQIILRATAIGQEFSSGDGGGGCRNAMMNAHPEMRVGAPQPWTPSVYFYEP